MAFAGYHWLWFAAFGPSARHTGPAFSRLPLPAFLINRPAYDDDRNPFSIRGAGGGRGGLIRLSFSSDETEVPSKEERHRWWFAGWGHGAGGAFFGEAGAIDRGGGGGDSGGAGGAGAFEAAGGVVGEDFAFAVGAGGAGGESGVGGGGDSDGAGGGFATEFDVATGDERKTTPTFASRRRFAYEFLFVDYFAELALSPPSV